MVMELPVESQGLLPCPFCGGEPWPNANGGGTYLHAVVCSKCFARSTPIHDQERGATPELVAYVRDAWNRRATPPSTSGATDAHTGERRLLSRTPFRGEGLYFPPVEWQDHGGPSCGAEFTFSQIEYARALDSDDNAPPSCEMRKGHAGAHIDDSMAGRIAWMTTKEADAADAARRTTPPAKSTATAPELLLVLDDTRVTIDYWALWFLASEYTDGACCRDLDDEEACAQTSLCITEWCIACVGKVIHDKLAGLAGTATAQKEKDVAESGAKRGNNETAPSIPRSEAREKAHAALDALIAAAADARVQAPLVRSSVREAEQFNAALDTAIREAASQLIQKDETR